MEQYLRFKSTIDLRRLTKIWKLLSKEFDTVLVAIGRNANTSSLNLEKIGVKINKKNNKVEI